MGAATMAWGQAVDAGQAHAEPRLDAGGWGEPAHGLRVRIVPATRYPRLGGDLVLLVMVQNVSEEAIDVPWLSLAWRPVEPAERAVEREDDNAWLTAEPLDEQAQEHNPSAGSGLDRFVPQPEPLAPGRLRVGLITIESIGGNRLIELQQAWPESEPVVQTGWLDAWPQLVDRGRYRLSFSFDVAHRQDTGGEPAADAATGAERRLVAAAPIVIEVVDPDQPVYRQQ